MILSIRHPSDPPLHLIGVAERGAGSSREQGMQRIETAKISLDAREADAEGFEPLVIAA